MISAITVGTPVEIVSMEWPTVFDGLAGSLTSPEKPVENVPLHKGPPQLLQGARTSSYMRTCGELEPPCSFWLQLSEYDWMPHIII